MKTEPAILCQVFELTASSEDGPPEWMQLLPAAGVPFQAIDGRGPWRYDDATALISSSLSAGPIIVDVNHSTIRRTPKGEDAPAMGRVVELQARADGLWGRVEWNAQGRALMGSRPYAYSGVSPVLLCAKSQPSKILRVAQVSLTNVPALGGSIASLTMETEAMGFEKFAKAVGLAETASEEDILAAITALKKEAGPVELTALATVLGAEGDADVQELTVLAKALTKKAEGAGDVVVLTAQVAGLQAERFIERMRGEGYAIDDEMTVELTAMHADNPQRAEKIAKRLPKLSPTHTGKPAPAGIEITALTAEQRTIADQLGVAHDVYLAGLKADAEAREA
ncbi:phage protease [Sagittula salina]|uniref:Mu-like prophage I protein n=1 Tax=Sagittula salina TaxID=2820268 RepID=A0A940S1A8_9RHOB|nr:phage protease [Sagittula salina]MBP0483948.1 hypothetical protein [Sagittula salina]